MLPKELLSRVEAGLLLVLSACDSGGRRRWVATVRDGLAAADVAYLGRLTIPCPPPAPPRERNVYTRP